VGDLLPLVQHAGRAACDLVKLGEAVLIVPVSVRKQGLTTEDISVSIEATVTQREAENSLDDDRLNSTTAMDGVEFTNGNQAVLVGEGIHVSGGSDNEMNEPAPSIACRAFPRRCMQSSCAFLAAALRCATSLVCLSATKLARSAATSVSVS
jgi:hypothetical protein